MANPETDDSGLEDELYEYGNTLKGKIPPDADDYLANTDGMNPLDSLNIGEMLDGLANEIQHYLSVSMRTLIDLAEKWDAIDDERDRLDDEAEAFFNETGTIAIPPERDLSEAETETAEYFGEFVGQRLKAQDNDTLAIRLVPHVDENDDSPQPAIMLTETQAVVLGTILSIDMLPNKTKRRFLARIRISDSEGKLVNFFKIPISVGKYRLENPGITVINPALAQMLINPESEETQYVLEIVDIFNDFSKRDNTQENIGRAKRK